MRFLLLLVVVSCAVALGSARTLPRRQLRRAGAVQQTRLRRAPLPAAARRRTMLISGYYRPLFAQRRSGFEPETAMTAFATGDSVAAGSYLGTSCPSCAEPGNTELLGDGLEQEGEVPAEDFPATEEQADAELAPLKPARTPKKKPIKAVKPTVEDEDDSDDDEEAVAPVRGKKPHNSYFPIMLNPYPVGARSGAAGGGAGGVTAIANSYSTGKGGVATSHATAYGSGAPARSRKRPQLADDADDEE